MYNLFISLRYLRNRKISFFAVAGVAVGVMTLIVVLSVMNGFDQELRSRIRGTLAHIIILKGGMYGLEDYKQVIEKVKTFEHVTACAPYVEGPALIKLRNRKEFVYFKGIDPDAEASVGDFTSYITPFGNQPEDLLKTHGEKNTGSVFGGSELFRVGPGEPEKDPGSFIQNGEQIVLVTLKEWDKISVKAFVVVGKFKSGMYDFDKNYVYIPLTVAQELTGSKGKDAVTGISIKLDDYRYANQVRDKLQAALGIEYYVQTWEDARKTFLTAVMMERRVMAFILFFIIVVAGFNILAILTMIVLEKSKDIGILKALGATTQGIMSIFLLNGLLIGSIGASIGTAAGLSIVLRINWIENALYHMTGWRPFPPEVYYFNQIPTVVNPTSIVFTAAIAIASSVVFSIYPALRAARLDPVETLRYE
ncbi:MAG: ABC transporter permease [Candidatus Brocadia sp. AMX2]|nr:MULTISPECIES: ABC transporter permease [Brocadia]MBC6931383.1 ABC transporter permease [Candidatus Brocadia sp.]MBL1167561.1 ABC transporter permease [Candidatus Brocadia sp. AMX1]MCK6467555.1 ABC transporter permease [Candidatus Brocadia sinica]NOG40547.1 ABC transporter permease [Planctomycetota bacterium]KAA0244114.1 MAG: ABC transporter permease [Candidatus Brocadia sp. AMX2]